MLVAPGTDPHTLVRSGSDCQTREVPTWGTAGCLPRLCGWRGQVKPTEDKVRVIRDSTRPFTKKDVRSFLGLTGYYRRCIPSYADIADPLSDLTKKRQSTSEVTWNDAP